MTGLLKYAGSLWKCRLFWLSLAKLDLRKRYRRSVLGLGWALVQPVAMALVLCMVFGAAFGVDLGDHFLFVLTGLCLWGFLTHAVMQGSECIFWGETYIRQHRAPIAAYPLRVVLAGAFHFGVAIIPVALLSCWWNGLPSLPALAILPLVFCLMMVFGWSLAVIGGFANVYLPDTRHLLDVGMQVLFYATPIIWRPEMLRQRNLGWVVDYNPMAAFAELVRRPLLEGQLPSLAALQLASLATVVALASAAVVIAKLERRLILHL